MEIQLSVLASEALIAIYEKSDAELKTKLLEGTSWKDLKRRIDFLTEVSKELGRRNIVVKFVGNTPADTQIR